LLGGKSSDLPNVLFLFNYTNNGRLVAKATTFLTGFTANVGLISLNGVIQLVKATVFHSSPNTVIHEPSCLLGYAKRTSYLVRTNAILGVYYHPDSW
jgi:hypothetical protein